MFWESEPFVGAPISRMEVGKDVVFSIALLESGDGLRFESVFHNGLPVIQLAVVRDYNTKIEVENAYSARGFKARTFVVGRKRTNSPVEIVSCE